MKHLPFYNSKALSIAKCIDFNALALSIAKCINFNTLALSINLIHCIYTMDQVSQYAQIIKILESIERRLATIENRIALTGPGYIPKPPTPPFKPFQPPTLPPPFDFRECKSDIETGDHVPKVPSSFQQPSPY